MHMKSRHEGARNVLAVARFAAVALACALALACGDASPEAEPAPVPAPSNPPVFPPPSQEIDAAPPAPRRGCVGPGSTRVEVRAVLG
jgi:hypothetical protein